MVFDDKSRGSRVKIASERYYFVQPVNTADDSVTMTWKQTHLVEIGLTWTTPTKLALAHSTDAIHNSCL